LRILARNGKGNPLKLATLPQGRDGALIVVSDEGDRYLPASIPTLQQAIEDWSRHEPSLRHVADRLAAGEGHPLRGQRLAAPLPRAWQWLDGSAFRSHGELMERLFGVDPAPLDRPLMYQGMSHQFLGPNDDVPLPREEDGIDFEGEFGVIVDEVPMGVSAAQALGHIKLIVQINDWSLRRIAASEMKTGFGWVQAKPACSMAPFAVTPDELGDSWRDGRVHLVLAVDLNGAQFGRAHGGVMAYGFHELVAHAANTRHLCAGTIVGSGTVSNPDFDAVGASCIAERRAIETLNQGAPSTGFLHFGDLVRMESQLSEGKPLFGPIEQKVVRA
jgi:fumarylacetoacetate (FAA) hydrolase